MIADCPHCRIRVYFSPNGVCPACRKTVHSFPGVTVQSANSTEAKFKIYETDLLPPRCFVCNRDTERKTIFKAVLDGNAGQFPWIPRMGLFGGLVSLVTRLFERAVHVETKITISLPQCEGCKSVPEAKEIDAEMRAVTLVVHRQFAELVEAIRNRPLDKP